MHWWQDTLVYICGFQIWWRIVFFPFLCFHPVVFTEVRVRSLVMLVSYSEIALIKVKSPGNNNGKCVFFSKFHKQTRMPYYSTRQQLSLISGCEFAPGRIFPFDGPYSLPPFCCSALAGISVDRASPFNAPDRGLFAPIYVFSPITWWQNGGCQTTPQRWWWSPLWLVLPASCTIFFIFLDSIREEDSLIYLSLLQSVV